MAVPSSSLSHGTAFNPASLKGKPTFGLQNTLPRLPIPALQDTGRRYLRSLQPICSASEFKTSSELVGDFVAGMGRTLQARLLEHDKKQECSWLEDLWLDKAYLLYREPIMINVNWYMVFKSPQPRSTDRLLPSLPYTTGQLQRAAVLTKLACDYKTLLDTEQVPVDATKTGPLCMHQTRRMFGVTRIPERPKDRLLGDHPAKGTTAMILIEEQVFIIEVLNQSLDSIYANLVACIHLLHGLKKRSPPIGILTSEHRDVWAEQYKKIGRLNQSAMQDIHDSLFAVCLDSKAPESKHEAAALALHGWYGKNRWFDKCVQFFVCPNGVAGCNGEHSPCDAVIPNQMTTFILHQYLDPSTTTCSFYREQRVDGTGGVSKTQPGLARHLQFSIHLDTWEAINNAQRRAALAVDELDVCEFSPDAFFQAALQVAFYAQHGRMAPTYETASTRQFLHGRTETIRVCCSAAKDMAEAFADRRRPASEQASLARAFLQEHRQLSTDASNGQGVDRHLLGLRAMLRDGESHPLFSADPLFSRSVSFDLSTSNVSPGDLYDGLGFGPATATGYGINYSLSRDSIRYCVTCKKEAGVPHKALRFGELITDCIEQLHSVLSGPIASKV